MAKKEKTPLTFEELAREKERKEAKSKLFQRTFLKAFALISAFAIIFFTVMIAFIPEIIPTYKPFVVSSGQASSGTSAVTPASNTTPTPAAPADSSSSTSTDASSTDSSSSDTSSSDNAAAPADDNSIAAIVDYYKSAHSKTTVDASSVVLKTSDNSNYNGIVEAGGLSSIGKTLMNMFMKSEEKNEEIGKGALPPGTGISGLTADMVQEATRTDNGDTYTVYIKVKPDVNPTKGTGSGALVDIITEDQITGAVKSAGSLVSLSNISLEYFGCSIEATIDKATDHITYLKTDAPCVLSLDAKAAFISVPGAKVGIEVKNDYVISY